jgi:hypothetical protein
MPWEQRKAGRGSVPRTAPNQALEPTPTAAARDVGSPAALDCSGYVVVVYLLRR